MLISMVPFGGLVGLDVFYASAEDECVHEMGEWFTFKEPTCVEAGYQMSECHLCGYTETCNINPRGHDFYTTNEVAPTCIDDGYKIYTCSNCAYSKYEWWTPALGHNFITVSPGQNATCTKPCKNPGIECDRCGDSIANAIEPVALGHDFSVKIIDEAYLNKPANCTYPATYYYACSRVGQEADDGVKCNAMSDELYFAYGSVNPDVHIDEDNDGVCNLCAETIVEGVSWRFDKVTGTLTIYGKGEMTDTSYLNSDDFSVEDIKIVVIEDGITSICDYAFAGCVRITSVTISNTVTKIGVEAFRGCGSLTNVTIPESVIIIDEGAFLSCYSLTNIVIPCGVTTIGLAAFLNCTSLTNIVIPDSVRSIGRSAFVETAYFRNSDNWEDGVLYINNHLICVRSLPSSDYSIKNGTITITDYAFEACIELTNLTIPDSLISIGEYAFCYCEYLTSITFGKSVTTIGDSAFHNCSGLIDLVIPDSVTTIGLESFSCCNNLKNVTIGNGITKISDFAFFWCESLTNVTIGNSVTTIGDGAFAHCYDLINITIPNSVTTIGYNAFFECYNLTDVYYGGSEKQWNKIVIEEYDDDPLLNANIHFAITTSGQCGDNAYWNFDEETRTLTITGTGKIDDAILIGDDGWVVIDENSGDVVWTMPWYNIKNQIKTLVIEEGITEIGACAFHSLYYLTEVKLPSTLEVVGFGAFIDCIRLEKLDYPDSVKTLYTSSYNEISVKKIVLPKSLEKILPYAPMGYDELFDFNMCVYLESITVPKEIGNIEAVIDITNPSIRNIYNYSTEALIKFDDYATGAWPSDESTAEFFTVSMGTALELIEYPEILEDDEAKTAYALNKLIEYYGEDYLDKISNPVYSDKVGKHVTVYCYRDSAQHIYCLENDINFELIEEHTHKDTDSDDSCDICGESIIISGDFNGNGFWNFNPTSGKLEISGVEEIPDYKVSKYAPWYAYRDQIKSVTIESGVVSIGDLAFYKCSKISDIQLPDSVERIGKYAFNGCDSIVTMNIPSSVKEIDSKAFHSCNGLVEFVVSENNEYYSSIDGVLFDKDVTVLVKFPLAKEVDEYNVPKTLQSIGADSFNGCMYITKISFYAETIEENAFYGCENLEKVTIGGLVRTIEPYAFYNCKKLNELSVLSVDLTIGEWAFYKCDNLETINYIRSEEMWKEYDFGRDNKPLTKANLVTGFAVSTVMPPNSVITFRSRAVPPVVEEECLHKYEAIIINATCSISGYTLHTCSLCGNEYTDSETPISKHIDNNGDFICDYECGFTFDKNDENETSDVIDNVEVEDTSSDCACKCHKDGLYKIIFKFILFFQKFFRINRTCDCGTIHY